MSDSPAPKSAPTYAALAESFGAKVQKDPRGFTYITGEQCISRLNEVLGYDGWSFRVKEHGVDVESDEIWVLGELIVYSENGISFRTHAGEGTMVGVLSREQFGSQKHNRRNADGKILDYGFDLKGATTDALKKCASLVGVGLYLSAKEQGRAVPNQGGNQDRGARPAPAAAQSKASSSGVVPRQAPPAAVGGSEPLPQGGHAVTVTGVQATDEPGVVQVTTEDSWGGMIGQDDGEVFGTDICSECGTIIGAVKRQNGAVMTGHELAQRTRQEFGLPLCSTHYKAKIAAHKAAQAAAGAAPTPPAQGPQNAAQAEESASGRPLRVGPGRVLSPENLVRTYGDFVAGQLCKGYREPAAKGKQTFYITLGNQTGYNRETIHTLLGISADKDTHLESWLDAADTNLGCLLNILIRHHQNPDDTRIPTLADLA